MNWREWRMPLLAVLLASLFTAVVVAPLVGRSLGIWSRGLMIRAAVRFSLAFLGGAATFRLTVPRGGQWFAHLGEYFNPAVTLTSLIFVGLALHLQIATLKSAQQHLSEAQRQLSLSRVPIVLITQLYARGGQLMLVLECGAETAINVGTALFATKEMILGELRYSALFPGVAMAAPCGEMSGAFEPIRARVRWQNVHGTTFEYSAMLAPDDGGSWSIPTEVSIETNVNMRG